MKKKIMLSSLLLSVAVMLVSVFAFSASAATLSMTEVSGGTAPASGDTVTISSEEELNLLATYVNEGGSTAGVTFRLEKDITLTLSSVARDNIVPIGTADHPFAGIFDGNGHAIEKLNLRNTNKNGTMLGTANHHRALFAYVTGGTVKDLTVTVHSMNAVGYYSSAIVAEASGATVTGCTVKLAEGAQNIQVNLGSGANASDYFGLIVGYAKQGTVIDACVNEAPIQNARKNVGGIVGYAHASVITNCINKANLTANMMPTLGGIAGAIDAGTTLENCAVEGRLTGATVGGLVGKVVDADSSVANSVVAANLPAAAGVAVNNNSGSVSNIFFLTAAQKETVFVKTGTAAENCFDYIVADDNGTVTFPVGKVEQKACDCEEDAECEKCAGVGTYFAFTPDADGKTADALLNAYAAARNEELGAEKLMPWTAIDGKLLNCSHSITTYRPHAGRAPTCQQPGFGDEVCATCGKLVNADVEIPATPDKHTAPSGLAVCEDSECVYCGTPIPAQFNHDLEKDRVHACEEVLCVRCHKVIPGEAHTKPEGIEGCQEFTCTVCQQHAKSDVPHTLPEGTKACQTTTCTVCQTVIPATIAHDRPTDVKACAVVPCTRCGEDTFGTGAHRAGPAATCTTPQRCLECSGIINKATGHRWGAPAGCATWQTCLTCKAPNDIDTDEFGNLIGAPTGLHTPNIGTFGDYESMIPTCTTPVYCLECYNTILGEDGKPLRALGHLPGDDCDCGHGVKCERCHIVVENASGEHNIDWSTATVIRAATADRTGILLGTCSDCGKTVERYTTVILVDEKGRVSIMAPDCGIVAGSVAGIVYGKVVDYKNVTLADGFVALQVVTVSLTDPDGDAVALAGKATFKVLLNKSAVKMVKENLKLYEVKSGAATEITIKEIADGYIVFEATAGGTFLLAGNKTVALETIGSYIPKQTKQTAALVGTVSYEKRDDEI